MATYSSYKKIIQDNLDGRLLDEDKLQNGAGNPRGVFHVYSARGFQCHSCSNNGGCVCQACGRCCQWTVPCKVTKVTFEIWSGGGGGPGNTCCDCWQKALGGAGGNYAVKTIDTSAGCEYSICAGGSWPCSVSSTCTAGMGCRSYVTGYNLSNFCVTGGCGGLSYNEVPAFDPRTVGMCANCNVCGIFGADFGMMGSVGWKDGEFRVDSSCACVGRNAGTGSAPMIGKTVVTTASDAWCSCGCYVNWPAGGGMAGVSNFCGEIMMCCARGAGQGGSGMVKITFT